MSQLKIDSLANQAGTASTPIADVINGSARAFVNFNGTGTVAIRASYNVSSITDFQTGVYGINFTNPMPDTNYTPAVAGNFSDTITTSPYQGPGTLGFNTTSINIVTGSNTNAQLDWLFVTCAIFR